MSKVWSFNTTIRNPERVENMLRSLSDMEGENFDLNGQEKFFGLQIKKRLYKPEKRTLEEDDLISAVHNQNGEDLDDEIVNRILAKYRDKNVDGSGRGRTSAGILNRFALCTAYQSKGDVVISDLAKRWLSREVTDEELFTKFLLKWQYPNPAEKGYENFDIKPFVGTLTLIKKVNNRWKEMGNNPVGLNKTEYGLFVPSLISYTQIDEYVEKIVNFRLECKNRSGIDRKNFIKEYSINRVLEIGVTGGIDKFIRDLKDYTDSSVRYFRMTGLISLRGSDTHIDISKDKEVEVESILNEVDLSSDNYESYESYFNYLNDFDSYILPWESSNYNSSILNELSKLLKDEMGKDNFESFDGTIIHLDGKNKILAYQEKLNNVRINKLTDLKYDLNILDDCIDKIDSLRKKNYSPLTARPSLDFEWYVYRSLMVINDNKEIKPSFNVGDDNIPTGFRANTSDIECYYEGFNMTTEVTLMLGRDQWYAEGQPVMQHLRDFEDKNIDKDNYCIFIAPFIHQGTLNTFWTSNKYEFQGVKQRIVPMTIDQFLVFLRKVRTDIENNETFSHLKIKKLMDNIIDDVDACSDSMAWLENIDNYISSFD